MRRKRSRSTGGGPDRTASFSRLGADGASPLAVSAEGLNPEVVEHEREVYRQKARE